MRRQIKGAALDRFTHKTYQEQFQRLPNTYFQRFMFLEIVTLQFLHSDKSNVELIHTASGGVENILTPTESFGFSNEINGQKLYFVEVPVYMGVNCLRFIDNENIVNAIVLDNETGGIKSLGVPTLLQINSAGLQFYNDFSLSSNTGAKVQYCFDVSPGEYELKIPYDLIPEDVVSGAVNISTTLKGLTTGADYGSTFLPNTGSASDNIFVQFTAESEDRVCLEITQSRSGDVKNLMLLKSIELKRVNQEIMISEPYRGVPICEPDMVKIQYYGEDRQNFWFTFQIKPFFYVNAKLISEAKNITSTLEGQQSNFTLKGSQLLTRSFELTKPVPAFMVERLEGIFNFEHIHIDGDRYAKSDGQEFEYDEISKRTGLYTGQVTIRKNDYDYFL